MLDNSIEQNNNFITGMKVCSLRDDENSDSNIAISPVMETVVEEHKGGYIQRGDIVSTAEQQPQLLKREKLASTVLINASRIIRKENGDEFFVA